MSLLNPGMPLFSEGENNRIDKKSPEAKEGDGNGGNI
jgi:hypothetical protein